MAKVPAVCLNECALKFLGLGLYFERLCALLLLPVVGKFFFFWLPVSFLVVLGEDNSFSPIALRYLSTMRRMERRLKGFQIFLLLRARDINKGVDSVKLSPALRLARK